MKRLNDQTGYKTSGTMKNCLRGMWLSVLLCLLQGSASAAVSYVHGASQSFTLCAGAGGYSLDTILEVTDAVGLTETWTLNTVAAHGTISGLPATAPSAVAVYPSGVTYTATAGYTGTDSFVVKVSDGTSVALMTVYVTINLAPGAITGSPAVCAGSTLTLSDGSSGGTWTSSSTATATVGSSSGVVTGVASGSAVITYTLGGCSNTKTVTVNATPAPITGSSNVCTGHSITLAEPTTGGSWSSSNTGVATVGSAGSVSGVAAGPAIISYALPDGCFATLAISVNQTPATITGPSTFCPGAPATLSDTDPGGVWTSSSIASATVGSSSGIVTGGTPGSATITYTLTGGCTATTVITISTTLPPIAGSATVCVGSATTLTDPVAGGAWVSSNSSVATISSSAGLLTGVSADTATITYAIGSCRATKIITVNAAPAGITGGPTVCAGATDSLADATGSGSWASSNSTLATVGSASGIVTGIAGGTVTITYSTNPACYITTAVLINPRPLAITGSSHVCLGTTGTLADATGGGFWASSNSSVATVSGTGIVSGVAGGYDTISYILPSTGCAATLLLDVIAVPALTGRDSICAWGDTITLTDSLTGGIFSSASVTVATLGSGEGLVTGHAPGGGYVTYTLPSGCTTTTFVTVNPLPGPIVGIERICRGTTSLLTDGLAGGSWGSGNRAVATIDSVTGVVTGVTVGTAVITYTSASGCKTDTTIAITSPPTPIHGTGLFCTGVETRLTDSIPGGVWSSSNTTIVTVDGSGLATGAGVGTAYIAYTLGASCMTVLAVTVNPLPTLFFTTGGGSFCSGGMGSPIYVTGSQAGVNYQPYIGAAAVDTAIPGTGSLLDLGPQIVPGTYTVTARNPLTGCSRAMVGTATVSVNPLPLAFIVAGGGSICTGSAGADLMLLGSESGVNYQLYEAGTAFGPATPGTGGVLDFGLSAVAGSYFVIATNPVTMCNTTMTGAATITINATITPSVTAVSVTGDTLCAGESVFFTTSVLNGGTSPFFIWYVNGAFRPASGGAFSYVPANGDVVRVLVTSSAPCAVPDTASSTVSLVVEAPGPLVTITAMPGTTLTPGAPGTFTASVTNGGPAPTYQWLVNGVAIPGATSASYTTTSLSSGDVVTCVVISSGPCGGLSGSGSVSVLVGSLGVQALAPGAAIRVIPNPNNGEFTISGTTGSNADEDVVVTLTNMLGQEVYHGAARALQGRLNEHIAVNGTIASGMYVLEVRTDNGSQVFHVMMER